MKKYKYFTIFLSVLIILNSCQRFSETMSGSKRSKSGDEFLVHKKKPLIIPPDFDEIPSPKPAKKNEKTTMSDSSTSIEDLLNITTVTSADYNTVKALVQGDIDTFCGFKFITTTRLTDDGTSRLCLAWAEDGLKLGLGKDVSAQITERADKSYSTQVYYCMSIGATRMEEEKVVQIACNE